MTAGAAVAAAQGRARRRIVTSLREQGALSADQAAALPQTNRLGRVALGRLLRQGVVVEAAPFRYWLDVARLAEVRIGQRKAAVRVLIATVVVGLVAAVVAAWLGHAR